METPKKIIVDYSGSMINTTKVFAWIFLIIGIVAAAAIFFSTESYDRDEVAPMIIYILLGSIFIFLLLMVGSKIIQNLLYIRSYYESKVFEEGYQFTESNNGLK
jgi:Ca2+/Na+ antiporter